ncbi:MAG TPA: pectate lyase [Polyangiaceae bacterium]
MSCGDNKKFSDRAASELHYGDMAIRPDFARSAFLGLLLGFGLSGCGSDSGAETSGNGATANANSGGQGSSNLAKGGMSSTSKVTSSGGNTNPGNPITGGSSGSDQTTVGGTSGRTTSSDTVATSGGNATSEASGGRAAGGATGGAKSSAGGDATGGKATTVEPANGGSATGGRSVTGGASNGGASAGGKSATGGTATSSAATGGNATGGKSATSIGGAATGGAATGGAASGGTGTGGTVAALDCNAKLPAYTTSTTVSATITITGTKDYGMQRFCADPDALGKGDQSESQKPVFMLAKGAVLKNVIIGGSGCSAADGVHCEAGSCTLENVWIGDVGEDAISFKGNDPSQVMTINGGGAFEANDKVIQHNGPGTIKVNGFYVQNAGKLYRSCGNCSTQYARHIDLTNIFASGITSTLVGINYNLGDTATIHSLSRCGTVKTVCETFTGNDSGDEPTAKDKYTTSGDGTYCIYTAANILK